MFAIYGVIRRYLSMSLFCITLFVISIYQAHAATLGLKQSIDVAISQDIWHQKNKNNTQISHDNGVINSARPNPKFGLGISNIATDTFHFNQERMTQFKLTASQQFLRGDTAFLSKKAQRERQAMYPVIAQERRALVGFEVAKLWLMTFSEYQQKRMVKEEKSLLEQLISTAQRRYEVGNKNTLQNEVIAAQIELTVLEDQLSQLNQSSLITQQKLRQWLPSELVDLPIASHFSSIELSMNKLPQSDLQWSERLYKHPALFTFIKMHQALTTNIEIAKQQHNTQWEVNASYGLRSDDPIGESRSDLLSVGVSFDMPLFNQASNNSKVSIAKKRLSNHQTDRLLQLKSMISKARSEQGNLKLLDKRLALYRDKLLPQTVNFVESSSVAYRNNKGDLSLTIRAHLTKLNREIEAFDLSIKRQISILTLNYLLTQTTHITSMNTGALHE